MQVSDRALIYALAQLVIKTELGVRFPGLRGDEWARAFEMEWSGFLGSAQKREQELQSGASPALPLGPRLVD